MSIKDSHLLRINGFFESYAHAMEAFDSKAMAYHYCYPCMILDDDSSAVFTDAAKLEGLFNKGMSFYRHFGLVHAGPEIWSKRPWSDHLLKVKLNWKYYNADKEFLYDCDYDFLLRLDKHTEWKIQLAVSVNEKQNMEAWMQRRKG